MISFILKNFFKRQIVKCQEIDFLRDNTLMLEHELKFYQAKALSLEKALTLSKSGDETVKGKLKNEDK